MISKILDRFQNIVISCDKPQNYTKKNVVMMAWPNHSGIGQVLIISIKFLDPCDGPPN